MSSEDANQRPHVSDGKVQRAIWRSSDGNGDPDVHLYEDTRYLHQGHPTWKLYCGEAPASINGVFQDPPTNVYLDDRACIKVLHFPGYTGAERGKKWRHDFDAKGNVKPARKQRGRPALRPDGEAVELPLGKGSNYRFVGAADLREVELIIQENKAQANGQTLVVTSPPSQASNGTSTAKPKTKIKTKRKASERLLEGVDTRSLSNGITEDDDSMDFEKPKPSKKLKRATPTDLTPGSVADFKARNIALQTQLNEVAAHNLKLHNENRELKSQIEQSKILYARANVQLTQAHNLNKTLTTSLRASFPDATPSAKKEFEIVMLRNSASVYRTIAAQLWGQAVISTSVLDENAKAAEAIEDLTRILNEVSMKVKPAKEQHLDARKEWLALGESMKVRMGVTQFEAFEKEAMANLDLQ